MVCDTCAESYEPSASELSQAAPAASRRAGVLDNGTARPMFRRGRGCDACAGSGYRGRTGIYELMTVTDEVRSRVVAGTPLEEIRALARSQGMVPLREDGWTKVCSGITTIEELLRVTSEDEPQ